MSDVTTTPAAVSLRAKMVPQPPERFNTGDVAPLVHRDGRQWAISRIPHPGGKGEAWPPGDEPGLLHPFGAPGSLYWVKEEWAHYQVICSVALPDGRSFSEVQDGQAAYRSDGYESIEDLKNHVRLMVGSAFEDIQVRDDAWQPAHAMPRWAARDVYEILTTSVEHTPEGWFWVAEADPRGNR